MSQRKLSVEVNKFNKGIVGSASPVDFPIDAASVMKNFIIEKDGSLRKRGGLLRQGQAYYISDAVQGLSYPPVKWPIIKNPSGVDGYIVVSDMFRQNESPAVRYLFTKDTSELVRTYYENDPNTPSIIAKYGPSVAVVGNSWYETSAGSSVDRLRYDPINKKVLIQDLDADHDIYVRDTWGSFPDTYETIWYPPNNEPIPMPESDLRSFRYNAANRGFNVADDFKRTDGTGETGIPGYTYSPHITRDLSTGDYIADKQTFELNKAPSGRFKLKFLEFDRYYTAGGGPSSNTISDDDGNIYLPKSRWTEAFTDLYNMSFAGRIFYWCKGAEPDNASSSVPDANTPNPNTMILFSQVIVSGEQHTKCYSSNDPTSGISNEGDYPKYAQPLETDGGVIVIEGSGAITGLHEFGDSLIVFAENGIWEIRGPFSPISYTVNKVSEITCVSYDSIISINNQLMFMSNHAICAIKVDARSRTLFVEEVSSSSMGNIYADSYRPSDERFVLSAALDKGTNVVHWAILPKTNGFSTRVARVLCYDVDLMAFYEKEFTLPAGYQLQNMYQDPLSDSGICYLISWSNPAATSSYQGRVVGVYKEDESLNYDGLRYYPWATEQVPFSATLETGAASFGDASKAKNAPYISLYFKQTEGSYDNEGELENQTSCLMQVKWDFSRSADTGKWTDEREMYRLRRFTYPDTQSFDYGYDVVVTKNKIRGRGKAMRLKLTVPEGKVCHLYGWNFTLMANSEV